MFKNILATTDGSATAQRASQEVAALAAGVADAHVTVVLAINPLDSSTSDYDEETIAHFNTRMRGKAEEALRAAAKIFQERNVACTTKVIEGDPVSLAVAQEAESGTYDIVAMGSRGLGMQKNDLHYLGSVTERVIRRVSIPVLVLPTHVPPSGSHP